MGSGVSTGDVADFEVGFETGFVAEDIAGFELGFETGFVAEDIAGFEVGFETAVLGTPGLGTTGFPSTGETTVFLLTDTGFTVPFAGTDFLDETDTVAIITSFAHPPAKISRGIVARWKQEGRRGVSS